MRHLAAFLLVVLPVAGARAAVPELSELDAVVDKVEAEVLTLRPDKGAKPLTFKVTARTRCFLEVGQGSRLDLHEVEAGDVEAGLRVKVFYRAETGDIVSLQLFPKAGSILLVKAEAEHRAEAEAEKAEGEKPTDKPGEVEPPRRPGEADAARNERAAGKELTLAKRFLREARFNLDQSKGLKAKAREKLETVVKKYPGTNAAAEAKKLLDGL